MRGDEGRRPLSYGNILNFAFSPSPSHLIHPLHSCVNCHHYHDGGDANDDDDDIYLLINTKGHRTSSDGSDRKRLRRMTEYLGFTTCCRVSQVTTRWNVNGEVGRRGEAGRRGEVVYLNNMHYQRLLAKLEELGRIPDHGYQQWVNRFLLGGRSTI